LDSFTGFLQKFGTYMEINFQAIKTNADDAMLLELQHNITRMNLHKVRGIWSFSVPYKRTLVSTIRRFLESKTDPTPKQIIFITTYNYITDYAKDRMTDDYAAMGAWLDGMVNGTTRYWGPENGPFYKRLYNQTYGDYLSSWYFPLCRKYIHITNCM
jgi:hypothetical protein